MTNALEDRIIKEFTPEDEKKIILALRIYYSHLGRKGSTTLKGAIVRTLCHYDKFINNSEVGRLYERILDYMDLVRVKGFMIGMPGDREEARFYLKTLDSYLTTKKGI